MSYSPHQTLANISEHRRDVEGVALKELTAYRSTLMNNMKQSSLQLNILREQREKRITQGSRVDKLLMLEQSLNEHQIHIQDITCELAALDIAIRQQKKKWSDAHKKHKSHEKLHDKLQKKAERMMGQKLQMMQDDQFSAKMVKQQASLS